LLTFSHTYWSNSTVQQDPVYALYMYMDYEQKKQASKANIYQVSFG